MGLKMQIFCGTWHPRKIEIDLDDYGDKVETNVSPEEYTRAFDLLRATMDDTTFADDHFRNDDAVDGCIALHVLGYDAKDWFGAFCEEQKGNASQWFIGDLVKFMEHVERVSGYLSSWGPENNRGAALNYAIYIR